jgi:hypothetical protein
MIIIRYSIHKFEPQYQSEHLKHVNYHLYNFDISEIPEHLKPAVQERHDLLINFYKENYNDLQYGIWVFIDGYKNNQSLNHLKRKTPYWKAEISDDTIVYDVNWDRKMKITDKRCKFFGCYIPKNQLNTLKELR